MLTSWSARTLLIVASTPGVLRCRWVSRCTPVCEVSETGGGVTLSAGVAGGAVVERRGRAGGVGGGGGGRVPAGRGGQRAGGEFHARRGVAGGDEVVQLAGHELADVLLRLPRRPADVRRDDDVGQPAQL